MNQQKLRSNCTKRTAPNQQGAAREGHALLQGLVLCGKCGHRMTTYYQGPRHRVRALYQCRSTSTDLREKSVCWMVSTRAIDAAVMERFFQVVQPPEVELSLAVTREVERQAGEVDRQWQLRLDRGRYEARMAERRYKAVDPDNRVVARTLEQEWNEKLQELEEIDREYQEARQREKVVLTSEDRKRLLTLTKNLRQVWDAPSTTHAERKNLLRIIVREVSLTPVDVPDRLTRVRILWQTGATSDFTINRPSPEKARANSPGAAALVKKLVAEHLDDPTIVAELNRRGMRTGADREWTVGALSALRRSEGLYRRRVAKGERLPLQRADGLHSTRGVAQRLGVSENHVSYLVRRGVLRPVEGGGAGRTKWFELDGFTLKRLRQRQRRAVQRSPDS